MTLYHTIQFAPTAIRIDAIKKAKQTLYDALQQFMYFRSIQELGSNSLYYMQAISKIQTYIRHKISNYSWRVKHHISFL